MNKSGVSPLISTIILLVFATGLGAIVMSWGSSYAQVEIKESCSKTSISIVEIKSRPKACISQGSVYYTIQNTGETNIYDYRITLIGSKGIDTIDVDQKIDIGEIVNGYQVYNHANVERVDKIIFMPRLDNGKIISCPKSSATLDYVDVCVD